MRGQAVTVTDENDVIYDIVNIGSSTDFSVVVSTQNKSVFQSRQEAVTIPATLKDHSSGGDASKTYSVVGISANAFKGTAITSLSIEAPVSSIASSAFEECAGLASVSLPSTLKEIEEKAFCGCTSLATVTGLGSVETLRADAFSGCSALAAIGDAGNLKTI